MPQSFHIVNLGCKVNRVEADNAAALLLSKGCCESDLEAADIVVVNTCTVTGEADKKARKAVRHALAANTQARVVVTGCSAALDPQTYLSLDPRVEVVGRSDLATSIAGESADGPLLRIGDSFRTRVNLKVQDGCDHACTYCIVHVARGKATSVPIVSALEEARRYLDCNVAEIVLAGIDVGSYRSDGADLAVLTRKLKDLCDDHFDKTGFRSRIRLSSVEPVSVTESLATLIAASQGTVCRHLHLPLQSGSSKVLAEMNRPYSAEQFVDLVRRLRSLMPTLSLTTDIIVGFPGESDDDFERTLQVARTCGFSKIHVFPYSMREGTPAAQRKDQIDPEVKAMRARTLRSLSNELANEDYLSRIGTTEFAVVEPGQVLTESYHVLPVPEGAEIGRLVELVIPSRK